MTPELLAAAVAVAFALLREVYVLLEARRRRRGELRTRDTDHSAER